MVPVSPWWLDFHDFFWHDSRNLKTSLLAGMTRCPRLIWSKLLLADLASVFFCKESWFLYGKWYLNQDERNSLLLGYFVSRTKALSVARARIYLDLYLHLQLDLDTQWILAILYWIHSIRFLPYLSTNIYVIKITNVLQFSKSLSQSSVFHHFQHISSFWHSCSLPLLFEILYSLIFWDTWLSTQHVHLDSPKASHI